jgi:hypothetical protein
MPDVTGGGIHQDATPAPTTETQAEKTPAAEPTQAGSDDTSDG